MPQGFGRRTYQKWIQPQDLVRFDVKIEESELMILAQTELRQAARRALARYRTQIERYVAMCPEFRAAFTPLEVADNAPPIIHEMAAAARQAEVGPFAAVAGAMAEYVGKALLPFSPELLVENGGDIFLAGTRKRTLGIFAGASPLSGKIALQLDASLLPCGVCTSSGTVGHSVSLGKADAAIVLATSTALADACATALGNLVRTSDDIPEALQTAERIAGVKGAVIIVEKELGVWGALQLVRAATPAL